MLFLQDVHWLNQIVFTNLNRGLTPARNNDDLVVQFFILSFK